MAEQVKRLSPRERTRRDLLAAARDLLIHGEPLTVQGVADRAGVSRATAYRYFASNDAVALNATLPGPDDPFTDPTWPYAKPKPGQSPAERIATVVRGMAEWAFDNEAALRTVLGLSLQPDAEQRGFARAGKLGRFNWIDAALTDLPASVTREQRRRLRMALLPLFGADAIIWTVDVAGLDRKQAVDQLAWTAQTLVQGVMGLEG